MPNYCDFKMNVRGIPANVDEFIKIIQAPDYTQRHFYRVFEADIINETIDVFGLKTALIDGYCAWSVYSCMMEGPFTYYDDVKNDSELYTMPDNDIPLGTSLIIESKRLGLILEVYSDEPGMGFQEHIYIANGTTLCNDCIECYTYWLGDNDTYQEYIEDWYGGDTKKAEEDKTLYLTEDIFNKCKEKGLDEYKKGGYEINGEFIFQMENLEPIPAKMVMCKIVK